MPSKKCSDIGRRTRKATRARNFRASLTEEKRAIMRESNRIRNRKTRELKKQFIAALRGECPTYQESSNFNSTSFRVTSGNRLKNVNYQDERSNKMEYHEMSALESFEDLRIDECNFVVKNEPLDEDDTLEDIKIMPEQFEVSDAAIIACKKQEDDNDI